MKPDTRKTFAAVGTGGRIPMFIDPIAGTYRDVCHLVGLCDRSAVRRTYHQQRLAREFGIGEVPVFADFDQMMRETRPETVIVCTPDHTHREFVIKALEAGADVICEKPLTIDAESCRDILAAVERTGRRVRTTFNMRWTAGVTRVREIIASGAIGQVHHIDFEYYLNTSHGADYFRRWHSEKSRSGGLLLHKSTHHFDIINWWLNAIPSAVFALGGLVFYGRSNALARGQECLTRYDRYTGHAEAKSDPFRLALDEDATLRALYLEAEAESGYIRDRNVFREGIDIEDSMSLLIRYRTGQVANYSLNAYCPDEGFRASICGDAGRIDYSEKHDSHIITGVADPMAEPQEHSIHMRIQQHFEDPQESFIPVPRGSHGGGDVLIQEQMFAARPSADPLGRNAGHEQGAASILIGAAANISLKSGSLVAVDDLVPLRPGARFLDDLL